MKHNPLSVESKAGHDSNEVGKVRIRLFRIDKAANLLI